MYHTENISTLTQFYSKVNEKLCRKILIVFQRKRSVERYQISTKCQRANLLVGVPILHYYRVDYVVEITQYKVNNKEENIIFIR